MQNCGMAPPFVSWAEALSTQRVGEDLCFWPAPNFGQKIGLNLREDLFFGFQLILDRKIALILGEKIFILIFVLFKFSEFLPPPFQNSAYATGWDVDQMLYLTLEKHKKC